MKNLFFLFLVMSGLSSAKAQMPSNCEVSPILQYFYDRDVKHLALTRIYDLQSPAMDSIEIPMSYQDTIWQAMAAIFNLDGHSARDSVFDKYCIHQYGSYYLFSKIYVSLTPDCPWLQQWKNLVTTTGVAALDSLLSDFGFTVTGYWALLDVATLTTTMKINVFPVMDSIETFAGVEYSEPSSYIGDGDKIQYSTTGTERFLDFEIGYGDCMSGCTGYKGFKFKVYQDCGVDYLGSVFYPASGYDFPLPENCNITLDQNEPGKAPEVHVYPNPAEETLEVEGELPSGTEYFIFNILGTEIIKGKIAEERSISLTHLPPGIYFIVIKTCEKRIICNKFIRK